MKYPIQVLFREYFEGILAAIFLALFLRFFVLNVLFIPTENMAPNLVRGDFVLGWRLSYGFPLPLMKGERLNFKVPHRGDLIAFRFPGDDEQIIIRRVIALPGDTVEVRDGRILVNNKELQYGSLGEDQWTETSENVSYSIMGNPRLTLDLVTVPEEGLFVLSDNRHRGDDSRDWGFVPFKNVESKIALIWLSVDNREQGFKVLWPRIFSRVR